MIVIYHARLWEERMTKKPEGPRYWRALNETTGAILKALPHRPARSWDLASDGVDLRLEFMGQAATVTLECVDVRTALVVDRTVPHPAATRLSDERVAELLARFA